MTVLELNHVIWAITREYRPRRSSWALEEEEKKYSTEQDRKKVTKGYTLPIWRDAPLKRSTSKIV